MSVTAPIAPAAAAVPAAAPLPLDPRPGLGLTPPELEDLLTAVGDREDLAGPDERARLRRGRHAIEAELARLLAE